MKGENVVEREKEQPPPVDVGARALDRGSPPTNEQKGSRLVCQQFPGDFGKRSTWLPFMSDRSCLGRFQWRDFSLWHLLP